ncbi:hypothetical protein G9P44_001950 [Scheffersomyces stipitis]|nr:hypothetical protein G9P44_001950 [Scheffersomyces stipitis]
MISIRDTISRIARTVRQTEPASKYTKPKTKSHSQSKSPSTSPGIYNKPKIVHRKDVKVDLKNTQGTNFQIHTYRDFLAPLGIPNLKVFNDELPPYSHSSAHQNWRKKQNSKPVNMFNNFLQDRSLFEKMMDFLINITPEHLKNTNFSNDMVVRHVLEQEEKESDTNRFPELSPRNSFGEVPSMPQPLTVQNFQEYIYTLTHSNFYYRNSSSLTSGLVPDILLYTHKLTNDEFKPYRSVHTYNYLIKFFGFDKNQSSFARELLLVMNKDGHKPNIDTINHLLKLASTHSHIRTNTNTYQVIMKYLQLCQSMNIDINLSTFSRIYDSINNIFLKESFLNHIQRIKLPISKNLLLKILDDFMATTKDTGEVINFIENDLGHSNWKSDSKILNKVVYHKALQIQRDEDVDRLWRFVNEKDLDVDEYTLKSFLEGVRKNKLLDSQHYSKAMLMLSIYVNVVETIQYDSLSNVLRVYQFLLEELVRESEREPRLLGINTFIARGVVYEASGELLLPSEITQYGNSKRSASENYKILRRVSCGKLEKLEAITDIYNKMMEKFSEVAAITEPHKPFSEDEIQMWQKLKSSIKIDNNAAESERSLLVGICREKQEDSVYEQIKAQIHCVPLTIPPGAVDKYRQAQLRKYETVRARERSNKMELGVEEHTRQQMRTRGIYDSRENMGVDKDNGEEIINKNLDTV